MGTFSYLVWLLLEHNGRVTYKVIRQHHASIQGGVYMILGIAYTPNSRPRFP